jgi:ABC-2 type transport system permease protein
VDNKVLQIIRREYMQRIQKKSFWISTVLMPVIFLAMGLLPMMFRNMRPSRGVHIAVIDLHGKVFDNFRRNLLEPGKGETMAEKKYDLEQLPPGPDLEASLKTVKQEIGAGKLDGCLVVGKNFEDDANFTYYGRNVSNIDLIRDLGAALTPVVAADRLERDQINATPEKVASWIRRVNVDTFQVQEGGTTKKSGFGAAYAMTFGFIFILYLCQIIYGVANMRGVLEEKTARIMEVLLSTFSSGQLMTGKLVGIGLVGLTQIMVYAVTAAVMTTYAAVSAMSVDPNIRDAVKLINPMHLVYFVIYFLFGYFIYSALFLGIGSLCSSEEDAQNLQAPVMFLIVVPFMFTFFFVNNPDSAAATVVSLIPLFSPMVMMMRILVLTPPLWQILLSIGLCSAFLVALMWAVTKVFRIGVLSYGKRPSFAEIVLWVKNKG